MHRRNHKTRKVSRKLRYTKRRSLRLRRQRRQRPLRSRRAQSGGMVASVMSPEGIPIALQGSNTDTTVIKKVGDVPTVMSYKTYANHYKGRDESEFD